MGTTLSVPLKEQENLKELFRLLDENGMEKEKKQVMELADYLDGMDEQFGAVLNELKEVREELGRIQDKGIKSAAVKVVTKVEGKIETAREQLHQLKERFMDGVSHAVTEFKDKGVQALAKAVDVIGIQKGLQKIREQLNQSILTADRGIDHLVSIADELHDAKAHIGNISRVLSGREPAEAGSRDVEKGGIFQVQKALYHAMGKMKGMEQWTGQKLDKLEHLAAMAETSRKPSVRGELKNIQKENEQETVPAGLEKGPEATISFYAAECMEFVNYGELHENLSLPQAVKAYKRLRDKRTASGPGIGFVLQDKTIPDYADVQWPLFQGQMVAEDMIQLIPAYQEHPLVKQAVQDMKTYLPELTKERQKKTPQR